MYSAAWNALVTNFGHPQTIVNTQMKQIQLSQFIKSHDSAAIIKYAQLITTCVNVLKHFGFTGDLNREKRLQSYGKSKKQLSLLMSRTNQRLHQRKQCTLKDGDYNIWMCTEFKQEVNERYETQKKFELCFCCLNSNLMKDCKSDTVCGVNGCTKEHDKLLHSDSPKTEKDKKSEEPLSQNWVGGSSLLSTGSSGFLQLIPLSIGNEKRSVETIALCDTGSLVSFMVKTLIYILKLKGEESVMLVAGIRGLSDMKTEIVTSRIGPSETDTAGEELDVGDKIYDLTKMKENYASCNLSVSSDPLADQMKTLWNMETYASVCDVSGRSKEEKRALEKITEHNSERCEVGFPMFTNSFCQWRNFLGKDPELKDYKATIETDLENHFVRIMEQEVLSKENDKQWYLPHHSC